jgi:hypothetical protein
LLSISLLALAACGGGAASPAKSPTEELLEPRSIVEAQEQIARARESLEPSPATGATRAEEQKAPSARRQDVGPPGDSNVREERPESSDACGTRCRALASMKRAVEALCRMTGDGDTRCIDAKRTLAESTTRLAFCTCEAR